MSSILIGAHSASMNLSGSCTSAVNLVCNLYRRATVEKPQWYTERETKRPI